MYCLIHGNYEQKQWQKKKKRSVAFVRSFYVSGNTRQPMSLWSWCWCSFERSRRNVWRHLFQRRFFFESFFFFRTTTSLMSHYLGILAILYRHTMFAYNGFYHFRNNLQIFTIFIFPISLRFSSFCRHSVLCHSVYLHLIRHMSPVQCPPFLCQRTNKWDAMGWEKKAEHSHALFDWYIA